MRYRILFTETASRDLEEAVDHIDHILFNPEAADHLIACLEEEIRRISDFPERHPLTADPYLRDSGVRFAAVKNYLAFYTVDHDAGTVSIIRFLYGKRDWTQLLKTRKSGSSK